MIAPNSDEKEKSMKKLATIASALLVTCSLSFAQNGATSKAQNGGSSKKTKAAQGTAQNGGSSKNTKTTQGPTGDAHEIYMVADGNKNGASTPQNPKGVNTSKKSSQGPGTSPPK